MADRWPCQVLPCDRMARHAVYQCVGALSVMTMACAECLEALVAQGTTTRSVRLSDSVPPPPVSATTKIATLRRTG